MQKNEFQKFWNRVGKKIIHYTKTKPDKRNNNTRGSKYEVGDYPLGLLFQLLIFETASKSANIKLRKASLSYEKINVIPDFVTFLNNKTQT